MNFTPHLFFSGDCADAFHHYHEVFGGRLEIMTHADLPEDAEPMPGAKPHHVMHAALIFDDGVLMGADDPTGDGGPKLGIAVAYTSPDDATTARIFDALSKGGEVQMPVAPAFWSSSFGACVDRFGVSWMVSTVSDFP